MLEVKKEVSLAKYTTFRIGGPAKFFVEVLNESELIEALKYAKNNSLNFFILGGGSNVLFNDNGFDGIVIKSQNTRCNIKDTKIECDAGLQLSQAVKMSSENGLSGLEWAAGVPGTIGGAVRGNAGAFGGCMADSIEEVKFLDMEGNSESKIFKNSKCAFDYRNSIFKQNSNLIILSCVLRLEEGRSEEIKNKIRENIEKRAKNQPKEPSSGSFFKNPVAENKNLIEKFERDMGIKCKDNKIPAGWLISETGLQGKKIGGAMVSEKHANFIINTGNATAEDVVILSSFIKQQVRDKFGIELQEEVQLVGF
jgi:UDP-N-acetylmuramate dehydrogenase